MVVAGGSDCCCGCVFVFCAEYGGGADGFPLGWMLLTPTVRNRWWRLLVCAVGIALLAWGCFRPDSLSGLFLK